MKKPERQVADCVALTERVTALSQRINDVQYLDYISAFNGGYYYADSLQLYSLLTKEDPNDIMEINRLISTYYGRIYGNLFSFGQDTFGNQFCFNEHGDVVFFNIETGEVETLARSFSAWENVLLNDSEYLTGMTLRTAFISKNNTAMNFADRLCPKIPFVTGGEYNADNLYSVAAAECLSINSNIAKQVHNLPNGTSIVFKVVE